MIRRLIRRVLCGALLWILIFFEVSILMFGLNLKGGLVYSILHYPLLAILSVVVAIIYFNKVHASFIEGFKTSIVMFITSIILDALISIPLFIKDWNFFLDKFLLIGYLEIILVISLTGYFLRDTKKPRGKARFIKTFHGAEN